MDATLRSLDFDLAELQAHAVRFVIAVLVLVAAWLIGRGLARGLTIVLDKGKLAAAHKRFFHTLTVWSAVLVGTVAALSIVGLGEVAAGILAGGSVTAIVIGFAFKEIGENLLAGLFLAFNCPFEVGNLIKTGSFEGTVRAIELRYTHIRTADGRDVYVPNSQIFNQPLENYTRDGLRRLHVGFGIDHANDPLAARELLAEKTRAVAGVLADPAPGVGIDQFSPGLTELGVYFWVDVFDAERGLGDIKAELIDTCRRALLDGGYTLSSSVTTPIEIVGGAPAPPDATE